MSEEELELELEIGPEHFLEYERVVGRVDEKVANIAAAEGDKLACKKGCSQCCVGGLELLPVEYFRILLHMVEAELEPEPRDDGMCVFLDEAGACRVYDARPLVCRTQGLPIRYHEMPEVGAGLRRLPIVDGREAGSFVTACELNFTEALPDLGNILADEVVQSMLHVVDQRFRAEVGMPPEAERIPLTGLADPDSI